MSLSRNNAADYIAAQLGTLLTEAGVGPEDLSGQLKEPIDQALMMTGVAYGDLPDAEVDDADALGFLAVLEYATLMRIHRSVLNRVTISMSEPGISKQRGQIIDNLNKAIEVAKANAMPFILQGVDGFSTGVISLDFIEPMPTW